MVRRPHAPVLSADFQFLNTLTGGKKGGNTKGKLGNGYGCYELRWKVPKMGKIVQNISVNCNLCC